MAFLREILIYSGSLQTTSDESGSSVVNQEAIVGKWEIDPDDGKSVQFRIPSESFGGSNDRIGFYASASGRIGIGTKDPESAFDIRDIGEDEDERDREAKTRIFQLDKKSQKFDQPVTGSIVSASSGFIGDLTGNASTATALATARDIGGVSFDGSGDINLPGVNTAGNQSTSGLAATATLAADATTLATPRAIGGVNFDGSAAIVPRQHKGTIDRYYLTPLDFYPNSSAGSGRSLTPHAGGSQVAANNAATFVCNVTLPIGSTPSAVLIYGSDTRNTVRVYICKYEDTTSTAIDGGRAFAVGSNTAVTAGDSWRADQYYLAITVTTDGTDSIYGGIISLT